MLEEAAAAGAPDPFADPEMVQVVGTMPLSTLAGFGGMAPDDDTLEELVQRYRDAVS